MGTNYYLKRIPTEEEISQCHQLLELRKIDSYDIRNEDYEAPCLESILNQMTEKLHIGKHGYGWRFLFHIHDDLYARSIKSCLAYLKEQLDTGLWRIMDEYGDTMSLDDFEIEIKDSLNGITIEEYYQSHPEERKWSSYGPQQITVKDGSRWWDADFC